MATVHGCSRRRGRLLDLGCRFIKAIPTAVPTSCCFVSRERRTVHEVQHDPAIGGMTDAVMKLDIGDVTLAIIKGRGPSREAEYAGKFSAQS